MHVYVAGGTGVPVRERRNYGLGGMVMPPEVRDRPCLYQYRFSIKTVPDRHDVAAQGVVGFDLVGNLRTSVEHGAVVAPTERRAYFWE